MEGAGVHQRAQVTAQVGRWPEGPREDERGHSAGESCRVCARVRACVTGPCPAAPHICCGLPGARGSCPVSLAPTRRLVGMALRRPACLRAHPVPRTGGLRACCASRTACKAGLPAVPRLSRTPTGRCHPWPEAPVVRSWTLLIEKDLLLSSLCTFDLVYFSPSSPSFVLEILGSPCPPPASKRPSGWSSGERVHFVSALGSPLGSELCRAGVWSGLAACGPDGCQYLSPFQRGHQEEGLCHTVDLELSICFSRFLLKMVALFEAYCPLVPTLS